MKKTFKIILPIIVIISFIVIMNAGGYLKKPLDKEDDVYYYLKAIENNIYNEDWEMAEENLVLLENAWDKVLFRIQMSIEGIRINDFFAEMAHLKGAINSRSREIGIIEIVTLIEVWNQIED